MIVADFRLIKVAIRNPVNHRYISVPVVSFTFPMQKVNSTSKHPAIVRIIQFISFIF